jgi:quercetin dioxygenase-like cupin family protein
MKILKYTDVNPTYFETDKAKGIAARVVIGKKDGAENFCMRVLEFSPGGYSPKHSHDWEHEMFIYSGEGEFYHNGQWLTAQTGNVIFIPSNEEHQIRNPSKELLIIVCPLASKAPEL